jgi:chitinase
MRGRIALAGLLVLLSGLAAALPAQADRSRGRQERVVVGYFASWDIYGRGYYPKDIPAEMVTHLNYAFGYPAADGSCALADVWADYQRPFPANESVDGVADDSADPNQHLFGNFNQLRKLKQAHPELKLLIALGGWTLSTYFSDVAATPETREAFVRSCIDTFIKGDLPAAAWPPQAGGPGSGAGVFDGIDIDWEYPGIDPGNGAHHTPEDRHNATLLFQEFRRQLDELSAETGKEYILTAALPAGNVNSLGSFELPEATAPLDWVNLLTYDFHGAWDPWTNFNSPFLEDPADPTTPAENRPFWNVTGTVRLYLDHGVPPRKLAIGIPFYAKQYIRVPDVGNGLYQPFDNTGLSADTLQWDLTITPTYHDLVDIAQIVTPDVLGGNDARGLQGYTRYWSRRAAAPWLYNRSAERFGETMGVFISYEDPRSVHLRVQTIRRLGLRGAMVWEISQDSNDHGLLRELTPLVR